MTAASRCPVCNTLLRELFGFDSSASYTMPTAPMATTLPAEVGSIDLLFSAEGVTDSLNPLAVAFDGGYVSAPGSINEVFSGGR